MRLTSNEHKHGLEGASYRELRLLEELEFAPELSQRRLAHRLGIALGVANLLVRNLVTKGYMRATRGGWKRWVYILTPAGVARKVHLTVTYVDRFLNHYRRVRVLLRENLDALTMDVDSRIAIYGTTELAELVYLALRDMGFGRIDFVVPKGHGSVFLGVTVNTLDSIVPTDYARVVVAHSADIESTCLELRAKGVSPAQIVIPLGGGGAGASAPSELEVPA